MAWTIDTDDFSGTACGSVKDDEDNTDSKITYPLLRTINFAISSDEGNAKKHLVSATEHPIIQNEESKTPKLERSGYESNASIKISLSIAAFAAVVLTLII